MLHRAVARCWCPEAFLAHLFWTCLTSTWRQTPEKVRLKDTTLHIYFFFYPTKASTVDMPEHLNDTIWLSDEWDLEKGTLESSLNVSREICTRSHAYPSKYHSEGLTWLLRRWAAPSTCGVCVLCHKLNNWFAALFIFRFEWHSGEFFQLSRSHLYSIPSLLSCRCERGGEGSRGTVAFWKEGQHYAALLCRQDGTAIILFFSFTPPPSCQRPSRLICHPLALLKLDFTIGRKR